MWKYDKKLQFPINIRNKNPKMAKFIISQYGGPDGELAASLRYLSQRFSMPTEITKATLNDIGTEELRSSRNGWFYSPSVDKQC
jgi:spore coat protein JC